MQMRKLAVGVLEIQRDRPIGLAGAAANLGQTKLEALQEIDAHAMLGAGNGVADGLAALLPSRSERWSSGCPGYSSALSLAFLL